MSNHTADAPNSQAVQHQEGPIAKAIEKQTAKLPSDLFLWAAGGAALASLALHCTGRKEAGNFIAQWTPTLLIVGLYNKLVKVHGHDQVDNGKQHQRDLLGGLDPATGRGL